MVSNRARLRWPSAISAGVNLLETHGISILHFSRFEMGFTVPAHILTTHPGFVLFFFLIPRTFMLHSDLCQEGLLQLSKVGRGRGRWFACTFFPPVIVLHIVTGKFKRIFFFIGQLCSLRKPIKSLHKG